MPDAGAGRTEQINQLISAALTEASNLPSGTPQNLSGSESPAIQTALQQAGRLIAGESGDPGIVAQWPAATLDNGVEVGRLFFFPFNGDRCWVSIDGISRQSEKHDPALEVLCFAQPSTAHIKYLPQQGRIENHNFKPEQFGPLLDTIAAQFHILHARDAEKQRP